jgi:hypothetical protein
VGDRNACTDAMEELVENVVTMGACTVRSSAL